LKEDGKKMKNVSKSLASLGASFGINFIL